MAENDQQAEPSQPRPQTWDYSSHPLEDGGMQIMAVVIGFLVCVLVGGVVVAWLLLGLRAAGPAP